MSHEPNTNYIESLQSQLLQAIEKGDREKELKIREELKDSGLLSQEEVEELEMYI